MWSNGGQRGLERLSVLTKDIEAVNRNWLRLVGQGGLLDPVATTQAFRVRRVFVHLVGGASSGVIEQAARVGLPIFGLAEADRFVADLDAILKGENVPEAPLPEAPEARSFLADYQALAFSYLMLARDLVSRDPVLAYLMLGLDQRLLPLGKCSVDQISALAKAESTILGARHAASLNEQLRVLGSSHIGFRQRAVICSSFLLITRNETPAGLQPVTTPTLLSDQLGVLRNITGLVSLRCRLKPTATLTRATRPQIKAVMESEGICPDDRGGRLPSRIASLLESTAAHVASSFFLANYQAARALVGDYKAECSTDAFRAALTMSRAVGNATMIDPDMALMIADRFHKGELTLRRCPTCTSTHLMSTSPIAIRRDVVLQRDCPMCRELAGAKSGERPARLRGRRTRVAELVDAAEAASQAD